MAFGKHVKIRPEEFGAVVFETLKEKVFVANQTGADIVALLQEEKATDQVIDELAKKYGCPKSKIETDVRDYIATLKTNELLA